MVSCRRIFAPREGFYQARFAIWDESAMSHQDRGGRSTRPSTSGLPQKEPPAIKMRSVAPCQTLSAGRRDYQARWATALLRGDVDVAFEFYAALRGQIADKSGRQGPDPGHQRGLAEARSPGEGKQAGHEDARQHTGGDDGAHEERHCQMGSGNRES